MIIMAQTKLNNPYLSKSKYNDISYIGKIYGNFKIVDFVIDKDGRFAFKCMCLCQEGKENPKYDIISPSKLINGKRISCGCKANNVQYNDNNYIGKTFGALTVLEIIENNKAGDGVQFRCHCKHCGDENVIVGARHAVYGRQVTCNRPLCRKKEEVHSLKYNNPIYLNQIFGNLKVIEIKKLVDSENKKGISWVCECQRDGNIITLSASEVALGVRTSCGCVRSVGEDIISDILKKYNSTFKAQQSFPDLCGYTGFRLRYDFAIYDGNNIKCLIEYDGAHHRTWKRAFGSTEKEKKENYKRTVYYDGLKTEYAKKHNVPLYRFYVRDVANNKNKVEQYLKDIGVI